MQVRVSFVITLATLTMACGDTGPDCDSEWLARALAGAAPGDRVAVGACRIAGTFVVPTGVTLEGAGIDATILAGDGTAATVELAPGTTAQPTRLTGMRVESDAFAGVLVRGMGDGAVELSALHVEVRRGIGVGIEGVAAATVREVLVSGGVTASVPPDMVRPDQVATHGLILIDLARAELAGVTVEEVGLFGILVLGRTPTAVEWSDGAIRRVQGTGVMADGGSLTMRRVHVEDPIAGLGLVPGYGGVFAGGAQVATEDLEVRDSVFVGLLHSGAGGSHSRLALLDGADVAFWAQDSENVTLLEPVMVGNAVSAITLVGVTGARVTDAAMVSGTQVRTRFIGTGPVPFGDGIHVLGSTGVELDRLSVSGNGRAQVLVDLTGGTASDVSLGAITVDGTGEEYGVVVQGAPTPADYEAGVSRLGATAANDAARTGPLAVLPGAAASDLPDTSVERAMGLAGIVMPAD